MNYIFKYLSSSVALFFVFEVSNYAYVGSPLPVSYTYHFLSSLCTAFFTSVPFFSLFSFLSSVFLTVFSERSILLYIFSKFVLISVFFSFLFFPSALPAGAHDLLLPATFFLSSSIISALLFSFIEIIAHSIFFTHAKMVWIQFSSPLC